MPLLLGHLVVAAAVTVAVGLLTGGGWAFLVGIALALSLWLMLFAGSYATRPGESRRTTSVGQYALAAVVGVVLGYAMFRLGGNPSFWAVGFIMAGVIVPAGSAASRESRTGSA
ncbi:hypothetical protein SAMN04489844_3076 [Nocardioides exalbidus]|uniref:Uncharacterized protein n=1 Tax=Nocardioides exalbidus TaxID=402596 RepID=A0A1H4VRX1_9ACTN|nr:hypothetical protein [Nocardioides exalbidus]SEC83161.1 hypothetical protein SAMN04489844_3076 [Nocardioides exalbidus]